MWPSAAGACRGECYVFRADISRRRWVFTEACAAHAWRAYEILDWAIAHKRESCSRWRQRGVEVWEDTTEERRAVAPAGGLPTADPPGAPLLARWQHASETEKRQLAAEVLYWEDRQPKEVRQAILQQTITLVKTRQGRLDGQPPQAGHRA
jgi:hypothetical protein